MRALDTYRSFIRNAVRVARENGTGRTLLRYWRLSNRWQEANIKAKIGLRAKQCAEARQAVLNFIFGNPGSKIASRAVDAVLYGYWSGVKPRTRVISRIMREVAPVNLARA